MLTKLYNYRYVEIMELSKNIHTVDPLLMNILLFNLYIINKLKKKNKKVCCSIINNSKIFQNFLLKYYSKK
jgi:hypothetical protein